MADTKLAQFIATKKLNAARILAASHKLETLKVEDRRSKRARKDGKVEGAEKKEVAKPRSGRPVTPRAFAAAMSGKAPISGPTKQRILRAINHILEQKKSEKVELKTLF
jgi:hypothetical protein